MHVESLSSTMRDVPPLREDQVELPTVAIDKPADLNVIVGQAHFIKTVEDLHEALAGSSPNLRFGLAFCEASGLCLVRRSGNDDELVRPGDSERPVDWSGPLLRCLPARWIPPERVEPAEGRA